MADIIIPSSGNVWNSGFVQLPVSQITPADMYTAWCAEYGLPSTGSVSNLNGDDGNTVCNGVFTLPGLSTSAFSVSYEGGLALYESANPNIHNLQYNYTGVDGLSDVTRLYFSAIPNPPDIALVWGKSTDVMSTNTKWQKNSDVLVIFGNWYQRSASATWNVDVAIKITPTSYEIAIRQGSGTPVPFQIFTLSGGQPAAGYGSQRFDYGIDGTYVFTNVANYINGLVKNGADNTPVGNVDIVSFNNVTDKVLQKVQSAVDGTYKLLVGTTEPTYVVVKAAEIGYEVLDPVLYNDGDEVNITLGQTSDIVESTPLMIGMTQQYNQDAATTKTVDIHADTTDGDVVVLFIGHRSTVAKNELTALGWVELFSHVDNDDDSSTKQHTEIFYYNVKGTPPTNVTVTCNTSGRIFLATATIRDGKVETANVNYTTATGGNLPFDAVDKSGLQVLFSHWVNALSTGTSIGYNPSIVTALTEQTIYRHTIGHTNEFSAVTLTGVGATYMRGVRLVVSPVVIGGTPTFKAMCRGEVKEYGLPVKRKVVAVTVESTPRVVGSTESDEMTGAYEIDVAPWEGRVMVYYVPNIGNAFIPNAAFPLGYTVAPTEFNGYYYEVITAGVSGDAEPVWVNGGNTVSGTVVLTPKQVLTPLMNGWLLPSRENV